MSSKSEGSICRITAARASTIHVIERISLPAKRSRASKWHPGPWNTNASCSARQVAQAPRFSLFYSRAMDLVYRDPWYLRCISHHSAAVNCSSVPCFNCFGCRRFKLAPKTSSLLRGARYRRSSSAAVLRKPHSEIFHVLKDTA